MTGTMEVTKRRLAKQSYGKAVWMLLQLFTCGRASAHTTTFDKDLDWEGEYYTLQIEGNFQGIPIGVAMDGNIRFEQFGASTFGGCKLFKVLNGQNIKVSLSCQNSCAKEPLTLVMKYMDRRLNSMVNKTFSVDDDGMRAASCTKEGNISPPGSGGFPGWAIGLIAILLILSVATWAAFYKGSDILNNLRARWETLDRLLGNWGFGGSTAKHDLPGGELDDFMGKQETTAIEVEAEGPTPRKDDMSNSRPKDHENKAQGQVAQ